MADLPTVNAIDDLKETTKEKSDQLQKTVKGGLEINRDELVNLNKTIMKAFSINEEMLNLSKMIRAEEYERWLEAQRQQKDQPKPEVKIDKSGFDQSWLLPLLGIGGLASAFVAITASITGLDAALKAVNLPSTFRTIKAPFSAIGDYFDKIRNMEKPKIPDMPKISFVDFEGKPYDFGKFKIGVPDADLSIGQKIGNAFKILRFNILGAFGLTPEGLPIRDPETGKFMAGKPVSTQIFERFDNIFKSLKNIFIFGEGNGTIFTAAESIKQSAIDFFNKLPRLNIELPTWAKEIPQNIRALLGSADEGTGILGFFSKAFSFLEPVLSPLKKVIGTIFRPFTQILLTVVDFVVGFYEGFTGQEGSLMDKLGAGLEGGIKGVIKGITEAIDLIFVQFPAWILGKLGFEDTANELKEFSLTALVDPIWESIKKFFTTLISGDISGAAGMVVGGIEDFFKAVLRAVLPDPTEDFGFFDPRTALQKLFSAMGTYEYAGINADTGELIAPPPPTAPPTTGAEVDVRSREVASQVAQPSVTVAAPQTSIQTDNSTRVNKTSVASASPRRDKKPWWAGRNYATN